MRIKRKCNVFIWQSLVIVWANVDKSDSHAFQIHQIMPERWQGMIHPKLSRAGPFCGPAKKKKKYDPSKNHVFHRDFDIGAGEDTPARTKRSGCRLGSLSSTKASLALPFRWCRRWQIVELPNPSVLIIPSRVQIHGLVGSQLPPLV